MDGDRSEVQRLYDACDAVFSLSPRRGGGGGGLPTLTHIRWLQDILDGMKAADVGIDAGAGDGERSSSSSAFSSSDDERSPRGRRFIPAPALFTRITYVHIHECDDFSIGVFCFPAGATLPLHDHPQMVVLSKLLYGSMRVSSYDWVTAPCSGGPTKGGLAKVVAVDELREAPCKASVLFPRSGGNIHTVPALREGQQDEATRVDQPSGRQHTPTPVAAFRGFRQLPIRLENLSRRSRQRALRILGPALHPHSHCRHAVRSPRRARAAVRGGPWAPVHLLFRHPYSFSSRYAPVHVYMRYACQTSCFYLSHRKSLVTTMIPSFLQVLQYWKRHASQRIFVL